MGNREKELRKRGQTTLKYKLQDANTVMSNKENQYQVYSEN